MKTQSVSQMSAIQSMANGRASKTNQSAFDSFMSNSASKVGSKSPNEYSESQAKNLTGTKSAELASSRDDFNQHKLTLTNPETNSVELDNVELDDVEAQVVQLLKDTFGLSEEDIVDVLEQLGFVPIDLAVFMAMESVAVQPVPIENIKAFIMEIHGVDDANLFLVSDQMSGELTELMNGIQEILSQELGIDVGNLSQNDMPVLQSFAEKIGLLAGELGTSMQTGAEEKAQMTVSDDAEIVPETLSSGVENEIPVVVEMSEDSGASNAFSKEAQSQSKLHPEVTAKEPQSPLGAFVERLSESFEQVRQNETVTPQVTMNDIVEQVVNHIRIRVLPQTTSMELQLNPESLGRVNLNVTSQNGTATATLTVQNQAAKEALESQISVLRENLESQGLKVEAVEVNVSEFGFKHPEDSNNGQYQQQKKSQSRRFRFDSASEVEEETMETEENRQDGNSVVDYTA